MEPDEGQKEDHASPAELGEGSDPRGPEEVRNWADASEGLASNEIDVDFDDEEKEKQDEEMPTAEPPTEKNLREWDRRDWSDGRWSSRASDPGASGWRDVAVYRMESP